MFPGSDGHVWVVKVKIGAKEFTNKTYFEAFPTWIWWALVHERGAEGTEKHWN